MRTAYKVWSGIAAGVFCLVAVTDLSGGTARLVPAATTATAPAATLPPVVTIETAAARPGSAAVVTGPVTRVIDGDTLEVAGERIRVLGIDSCAIGTPGGARAKDRATALLGGTTVALRAEPGVDRDHSGRELRYVEVAGRDFGLEMVSHDDTGVQQGTDDVDPAYLAQLRAADTDGRVCGGSSSARSRSAVASYPNCAAARAAGVTPLRRGEPGYSSALDPDGDGVACG